MPKKNSIINNNIIPEKEMVEDESEINAESEVSLSKPKRQISDAQREHLNKIRVKALEKKAEMKQDTLKAKLAKTIEKKELVKKYDEYTQEKEKVEVKKDIVKKEKKIIYKYASSDSSSSSSDENEDEKIVYVKKCKKKNRKDKSPVYQKTELNSLDSTLYKSSQEMLHHRAIEERVKSNLMRWNNAMMPQEY
jgi:hypothetical protein